MGIPKQEYWSELLCPPPRVLPDPEMEPMFLAWQVGSFTTEPPGKVISHFGVVLKGNLFCCCWFGSKGKFCPLSRKWRDVRSDIWKDADAGKDRGQEKGTTEDEMVGWHHWLNGHGFGWTPGVGDGQGGLVCCGSWGCKESDATELLNWTEVSLESRRRARLFYRDQGSRKRAGFPWVGAGAGADALLGLASLGWGAEVSV